MPDVTPTRSHMARSMAIGFAGTLALLGGLHLSAQGIGGGIASHDSRAPVTYAADRIELQDRADRVILSGGVDIAQAGLRLQAPRTLIDYSNTGGLSIQRITATGGVTVTRANERATGEVAIYDFNRRIITMAGDVRLRRGGDTLNGGRLTIDLANDTAAVDGRASGSSPVSGDTPQVGDTGSGRVTGQFSVPDR